MTPSEFSKYLNARAGDASVFGLANLLDHTPRTLIFGYNMERDTFHVYIGHDGLIHVLLYRPLGSISEGPTFLILGHSSGPAGGLKDNQGYVPNKRAYPESCDFEFCEVLKRFDVGICFTNFTEEAHATRVSEHEGYAGFTHEQGGCPVVDLHTALLDIPAFPQGQDSRALSFRLVVEASREVHVPIVTSEYSSYAAVASTGADAVLARATELFNSLPNLVLAPFNGEMLLGDVFKRGHYPVIRETRTNGGVLIFEVSAKGAPFRAGRGLVRYESSPENSNWKEALVGYQGRPFIAFHKGDDTVDIYFSQFGDHEKFLTRYSRMYNLHFTAVG